MSLEESPEVLLEVEQLSVDFVVHGGRVQAVRGVDLSLKQGATLAIIGESGCGKSVMAMSLLGLLPSPPAVIKSGQIKLKGEALVGVNEKTLRGLRGKGIGMIFQDPVSALNPTMRIGDQIAESLILYQGLDKARARVEARSWLVRVGIIDPADRERRYPFECSGGMLQRVLIASVLACQPALLVADEPTTALDVTVQAQVLSLIKGMQEEFKMGLLFITHDLGVVAQVAEEVAVMYAGQIVESGSVEDIFYRPTHPYTLGLHHATPKTLSRRQEELKPIAGSPPDLYRPPAGCGYVDRCPYAMQLCAEKAPPALHSGKGQWAKCWLQHPQAPKIAAEAPFVQLRPADG